MTQATGTATVSGTRGDRNHAAPSRGGAWRIVRTEARRGTALVMFVAVTGVGLLMLFTYPEHWVGRWHSLAAEWRAIVGVMAPIAVVIGAWQGSRDRRRGTIELIASTTKSPVRQILVAWLVPAVAGGIGSLLAWTAGALLVAPVATYEGTSWVWTVVGGVVGVTAFATIGAALGSLIRSVPVIATTSVVALLVLTRVAWPWGPATPWLDRAEYVTRDTTLAQVAWLSGLTLAIVVIARRPAGFSLYRRPLMIVPATLALSGFVALSVQDDHTRIDDDALALTCTGSVPELCVSQDLAILLDRAGPIVADETTRWDQFDDMPERIIHTPQLESTWPPPDGVHQIDLSDVLNWRSGLADDARHQIAVQLSHAITVIPLTCSEPTSVDRDALAAGAIAHNVGRAWGRYQVDPDSAEYHLSGEYVAEFRQLTAMPDDDQVGWINRYRDVVRSCDNEALATLGRELA